MKYGPANSNYRHGNYSAAPDVGEFRVALAKDLLRKVITTPCDGRGRLPFTDEEVAWAMRVTRERPAWALDTLKACGLGEST